VTARLTAAVLLSLLAGCGQKGPLYLPDKKKAKVPATQTEAAPAASPQQASPPQLPESSTPTPQGQGL